MRRHHRLNYLLFPLLLLSLGCPADDEVDGFPCECSDGQVCQNGVCVTPDAGIDSGGADSTVDRGNNPRCPANGTIISELMFAPDTDQPEWVELAGTAGTDLTGFRIGAINGNDGSNLFNIGLSGTIGADGHFLIASAEMDGADQVQAELIMQNGPDNVVFMDCDGQTVDAVGYGEFDQETVFAGEGTAAPDTSRGESLARCPGAADTNDNSADFHVSVEPTPKADNDNFEDPFTCVDCVAGSFTGLVTINELLYNPDGTDTVENEFVEIAAPVGTDLFGLVVEFINGNTGEPYESFALEGIVTGTGYFTIGLLDGDMPLPGTLQMGPDSVRIVDCADEVVDAVGYGTFSEVETFAGEGTPAAGAGEGSSLARCAGAADSGNNVNDFFEATPTPGASNSGFTDPEACGGTSCVAGSLDGRLVVNEVFVDGSANTWVEIVALQDATLTDAQVVFTPSTGDAVSAVFGADGLPVAVTAGQFVVITNADLPGIDSDVLFDGQSGRPTLPLEQSAGVVTIDDCAGSTVDSVRWGNDSLDGGEGTLAPLPSATDSIARCGDSGDTNDNGQDFVTSNPPSPGAQNTGFDAGDCVACVPLADGDIVINEFLPDEVGSESTAETTFVELRGTPGLCLGGLSVVHINGTSSGNTLSTHELVGDMPSDGYFVLGETDVVNLDQDVNLDLQGGPDNIVLYSGEVAIDAVGYGSFDPDGTFAGEDTSAPTTGSGEGDGIGRCPTADIVSSDSDNNSEDFAVFEGVTPGAVNPACPTE